MAKYYIKNARYGEGEGGIACGPVDGPAVAEVEIRNEDGNEYFVSLVDVSGFPLFLKTPDSIFDMLLANSPEDDKYIKSSIIRAGEYDDIFDAGDIDELYPVYRYLMYIISAEEEVMENFIKTSKEKSIDEICVPESMAEEWYKMKLDLDSETEYEDSATMKVISKRVMSNFDEKFNPKEGIQWLAGIENIDAETVIEDKGIKIFINAEWCSECPEEIIVIVSDESIFDLSEQFNINSEDGPYLAEKRDEICSRNIADVIGYKPIDKLSGYIMDTVNAAVEYVDKCGHKLNTRDLKVAIQ